MCNLKIIWYIIDPKPSYILFLECLQANETEEVMEVNMAEVVLW